MSSQYHALTQMFRIIKRMEKMQALHQHFEDNRMLQGFSFSLKFGNTTDHVNVPMDNMEEGEDKADVSGESQDVSEFDVQLAAKIHVYLR